MDLKERINKPVNMNVLLLFDVVMCYVIMAIIVFGVTNYNGESVVVEIFASIAEAFFAKIPLVIAMIMAVMTAIARIIYSSENKKRLLAYRIIMGICYSFTLTSSLLFSILFLFSLGAFLPALILELFIILVCILGIRNTYSKRILE